MTAYLDHQTWMQWWALIVSTFVSEDLTCLSAAWMSANGTLPLFVSWSGCFIGIWMGDIGLYALARWGGRPMAHRFIPAKWSQGEAIKKAERWMHSQAYKCLWVTRFLPGTRLPTYLAAGYLQMPFIGFSLVTASACLVWTTALFLLTHALGTRLLSWLERYEGGTWLGLGLVLIIWMCVKWAFKSARNAEKAQPNTSQSNDSKAWTPWEFWPAWLFYMPVSLKILALSIRYKGFGVAALANPGIETGGIIGESKMDLLTRLQVSAPSETAKSWSLGNTHPSKSIHFIQSLLKKGDLSYPFILKPDTGQRGSGVKKIQNEEQMTAYIRSSPLALVAQEYAPGPLEAGVFYYRFPHERIGHIFAITDKQFPIVTGDGHTTLRTLIASHPRAKKMRKVFFKRFQHRLETVLKENETFQLVQAGNHAQGCLFKDGMHLYSEALRERFDAISKSIPGFFIGRFDLRYADANDLLRGTGFKIVELNGAASEATNIYDPDHTLRYAYKTLFKQWELVFRIGKTCQHLDNLEPLSALDIIKRWLKYHKNSRHHPMAD